MSLFNNKTQNPRDYLKRLEKELLQIAHLETELMDQERLSSLNLGVPKNLTSMVQNIVLQERTLDVEIDIQRGWTNLRERIDKKKESIEEKTRKKSEELLLDLYYPTSGEWEIGEYVEIMWNAGGPLSDEIKIDLLQDGKVKTNIGTVRSEKKLFIWQIPERPKGRNRRKDAPSLPLIVSAGVYQIRISDPKIPSMVSTSAEFKIIEPPEPTSSK